jgi:hypothetical protein
MESNTERLINEMMVKGRIYIKAIKKRDLALSECFQDETPEADTRLSAAATAADQARAEYNQTIAALHAVREKK